MQVALRQGQGDPLRADGHGDRPALVPVIGDGLVRPGKGDAACVRPAFGEIDLAQEVRHEGVGRAVVDLRRGGDLLDAALVDQDDPVGHGHGLRLVVGDVDDGDAQGGLDFLDLKAHALAELGVQVGQGLVQQQQLRLRDQGPGQGHALLLTAGQLGGQAVRVLAQMDDGQHPADVFLDRLPGRFFDGQRVGHVVKHVHVRPDGVGLEHHADVPLFRGHEGLPAGDQLVVDVHLAFRGLFKPGDDAQHGGLAAAGGAQQGHEFSVPEGLGEILQDDVAPEGFGDIPNGNVCHIHRSFLIWRTRPWSAGSG